MNLMARNPRARSLIFCNTKRAAERVTETLHRHGFAAEVLSGDVPQRKRQKLIARIARGELPNLVATDVAARGLHIPEVTHVYNYDLPQNAEDYVHRIGRTARAGASGDAISLACEEYVYSLMDIEEYIGHRIPVERVTPELLARLPKASRPAPVVTDDADDADEAEGGDDPHEAGAGVAPAPAATAEAAPVGEGAPARKRRRRRRSGSASRGSGGTAPEAPPAQ
jgi:ATP-dependent RNA helicase RhlB